MVWITALFTRFGIPNSSLSPLVNVWEVDTAVKVVNNGSMSPVGTSGFYRYDFTGFDESKLYLILADGGITLPDPERYKDNSSVDLSLINAVQDVADQVWDEQLIDHTTPGSAGQKINIMSSGGVDYATLVNAIWNEPVSAHQSASSFGGYLMRLIGLVHENHFIDQTVYDRGMLVSARIRLYSNAASVGTNSNVIAIYQLTAQYNSAGLLETYKVAKA